MWGATLNMANTALGFGINSKIQIFSKTVAGNFEDGIGSWVRGVRNRKGIKCTQVKSNGVHID